MSCILTVLCCLAARTDIATPSRTMMAADPERRKKDAAAMVLQRLLRGRAAQTRMYEGLQGRIGLIRVSSDKQLNQSSHCKTCRQRGNIMHSYASLRRITLTGPSNPLIDPHLVQYKDNDQLWCVQPSSQVYCGLLMHGLHVHI